VAGHGSSSPWDIRATFLAGGRGVRRGVELRTPTGNVDLTPTVLHLVGVTDTPPFDGRVLHELLVGGAEAVDVVRDSVVVTDGGYRLVVDHTRVGQTRYLSGTRVERSVDGGPPTRRFEEVRRLPSPEARQAVAADGRHLYAITNRAISKLDKETGELVDRWEGPESGPIEHLNSGVVLDGVLHAAHSNYPGVPMESSIEMYDVATMEHVGSHSFGMRPGSATWIDRHEGLWWVGFANYEGRGGAPGRGPAWTHVTLFDDGWREVGGYTFPPEVVERFQDRSNSGGAFGPDGYLYATGHDAAELYVLKIPAAGSRLELLEIVPVTAEGQGIAWDPVRPAVLFTVLRDREQVVESRLRSGGSSGP
jgi:hypothetical protein